ncbi:ImuA family protein [Roseinatronobacter sp. NSM]|uniref:ImuA family protein n=1 Tax=Roseinatronobacter sp. NSM TaxID=3457785 RepID=UPI00403721A9
MVPYIGTMSCDPSSSSFLRAARVHEVSGAGAVAFAAVLAARMAGMVLWVCESRQAGTLHPPGLAAFVDPARIMLACTPNQTDTLAVAEEALRDGSTPLVVIAITRALDLRAGRRLQLAARAGNTTGLCIIPEGMGSNAAETRWHATPVLDVNRSDSTLMHWEINKNKSGTIGAWHVRWDSETRHLHVVSPTGNRSGSAGASG